MRDVSLPYFDSDGDNTAQTISSTEGVLCSLFVYNKNTTDAWIQLFDASSVTVGTTTPKQSYLVPLGDGTQYGAQELKFDPPLHFDNGIKYACTTTPTGSGDPSVGLTVSATYKPWPWS